jgi:ribonuclease Z
MNKFELHILGCGSALPTIQHNPSSQVLNIREKLFMIDCGEGTQLQFRKARLPFGKLNRIFISHLHGDHCFGLLGLISTLGLLGKTSGLVIHSTPDLETVLRPQLDYFCNGLSFDVLIEPFDHTQSAVIFQDRSVKVTTIPLAHRFPCAGFLFEEAKNDLHLDGEAVKFYNVPIKQFAAIKKGEDAILEDGRIIPNARLTRPADPSRRYAYCSDTAYKEDIVPIIKGVDLLYHEATFLEADKFRTQKTGHSTAKQAASIAKRAEVKKLMLGHYSSRYTDLRLYLEEAKTIFPNTILANELLTEKL